MKLQDFKDAVSSIQAKDNIHTSLQSTIISWVTKNIDLSVSTDEEVKNFAHEIYLSIDETSISNVLISIKEILKREISNEKK